MKSARHFPTLFLAGLTTVATASGCSSAPQGEESVDSTGEAVTAPVCGAPTNGPVQGYDVSRYQGSFAWAGKGVAFGYARVSDGVGPVDSEFDGNWARMKAAGVMRGAYQFFEPGEDEVAQANLMVSKVGGKLADGDLPCVIDVETTGGQTGATIAAKVLHWLQIVESATGRRPVIYTGSYFWDDNVGSAAFGGYPLWIAAYVAGCPRLPNGWTNWQMWQYSDGNGVLDHDVFNGSAAQLTAFAKAPNTAPAGFLDVANCTQIGGWSQDPDVPKQPIATHLYFDGPAGAAGAVGLPTTAGTDRPDLCTPLGSCNHAFAMPPPRALMDGKAHPVFAYGIDSSGGANTLLTSSPRSFTCAAPAPPADAIKRWIPGMAVLGDWKLSTFTDLAHNDDATMNALPKGPDLEAKPVVVISDDGSSPVWVIDGAERRHVIDPASMTAWRFSAAAKWPAAKVNAIPQGRDWPATPLLVQGSAPEVYMLDTSPSTPPSSSAPGTSPNGASATSPGEAQAPDAASDDSDAGSGCSVTRVRATSTGWSALALGVGMLTLSRRRRNRAPTPLRSRPWLESFGHGGHMKKIWLSVAALLISFTMGSSAFAAAVCYQLPFPNPDLADGWGSTIGRAHPHRGVDFPQPAGTPIPAVADGVVALITTSSCLGNVVVIAHADGMFSGYAHMITPTPLSNGTTVVRGQTIGRIGTTGTCTTGNHLHLTMAPTLGGYAEGVTVDPYAYIQSHKECGCDRTAGGVTFSCDGANAGKTCVSVNEPADPDSWGDNFLCTDSNIGLKWSSAGPIAGMRCTNVTEAADKHAAAWADNYACVPNDSELLLSWSSAGPIAGQSCVQWNEPADLADTWGDNYLCTSVTDKFRAGIFTFSGHGPTDKGVCVNVDEPADPDTWSDNFFCSDVDLGMKWSSAGPIAGMRCTNVNEAADKSAAAWADNFLCLPESAPYTFAWSSAGPVAGQECVRWYEAAEVGGSWGDNYLCVTSPGADGGVGVGPSGGNVPAEPGAAAPGAVPTNDDAAAGEANGCSVRQSAPVPPSAFLLVGAFAAASVLFRRRKR